jgi:acetyltransferase-like isoleucine patch superfamily enzyme
MCRKIFTHIFTTNFVGSLDIRASREVFPIGVRSPEITDSDWHDVYNRISIGKTAPIKIEDNVWIGDSVIVCKGVSIGENSIIGADAVVFVSKTSL